jgi:hypothetical protein
MVNLKEDGMRSNDNIRFSALVMIVLLACSGCATPRHPVPKDLIAKATVNNMADVRSLMGIPNPALQESIIKSIKEEPSGEFKAEFDGTRIYPVLAISGGAANGAYGAGLLKGWSDSGTRPVFKVVTGVSTGAICAPFAFLGSDYDAEMEKLYTSMSTKDVMSPKGPLQILFGDSLASNKPLAREIAKAVTPELLKKIAAEHERGRRLFVGTTYLDAQRFAVWDMGAIAKRDDIALFRKVILASAAIPIMFPPVFIHVKADGVSYDEMHVDGGTITQMFTLYKVLDSAAGIAKELGLDPAKIKSRVYLIRNGYVTPGYKPVKDDIAAIADRAFDTMINNQGVGDTYRIYAFMKKMGNDYNLAFIPPDFRPEKKEEFDIHAMKEIYAKGYKDAVGGYNWHKVPPGMEEQKF